MRSTRLRAFLGPYLSRSRLPKLSAAVVYSGLIACFAFPCPGSLGGQRLSSTLSEASESGLIHEGAGT